MRYTSFRFALAPTLAQAALLARHAGASRFAYNQCLRLLEEAAVDLSRALATYTRTKNGERKGRAGLPRRKRKGRCRDSFRLRN